MSKSIENQRIIKICIIQKLFYRDFFVLFDYKPTFSSISAMGIESIKIAQKVGRLSNCSDKINNNLSKWRKPTYRCG